MRWSTCAGLLVPEGATDGVATTHSEGSVWIRPRCGLLLREAAHDAEASGRRRARVAHRIPQPVGSMCRWLVADAVLLFAAGILGGLTGSIAGLASVATYPALLLVGLPPVTANVTNTVALVFNGSRLDLGIPAGTGGSGARGCSGSCRSPSPGGVAGAVLLLSTPSEGFERARAGAARGRRGGDPAAGRPRGHARTRRRRHATTPILQGAAIFAICIYGGLLRRRGRRAAARAVPAPWAASRSRTPTPPRTSSSASSNGVAALVVPRLRARCSGPRSSRSAWAACSARGSAPWSSGVRPRARCGLPIGVVGPRAGRQTRVGRLPLTVTRTDCRPWPPGCPVR